MARVHLRPGRRSTYSWARFWWAVLGAPTGKRLAPVMGGLVAALRRCGELDVSDEVAAALVVMSPATMDRRLAGDRGPGRDVHCAGGAAPSPARCSRTPSRSGPGHSGTMRCPGFVEIDLVGHEGGNAVREHAYTLTVTDIATGWTENRSVPNKARTWVLAALEEIVKVLPFPLLGIDSDNASEFIHHHLLHWCEQREITFTRSRPGNSNDRAHVEQKNWAVVRTVVGYHRYDTPAEVRLLNRIWALQSHLTTYFLAQQKLICKTRDERRSPRSTTSRPPRSSGPSDTPASAPRTRRSWRMSSPN